MAWKPTGSPIVRKLSDKWVVRVDGVDTTGKHKPKQLGTYKSQAVSFGGDDDVGVQVRVVGAAG